MDVIRQAEAVALRRLGELWAEDDRPPREQTHPFPAPWWAGGALFHLAYAAVHLVCVTLSMGAAVHHLALAGRAARPPQQRTGDGR